MRMSRSRATHSSDESSSIGCGRTILDNGWLDSWMFYLRGRMLRAKGKVVARERMVRVARRVGI